MKILVAYKSKTGFTKKYTEMIAKEIECTLMDFKSVTPELVSDYDVFVFGGGLHAGMVNGLKKAREVFNKSRAKKFIIFATGGTPNAAAGEVLEEMWKNNLSQEELENIPHFYMQSGICYENMQLPDKLIMKMAAAMLDKKKDKDSYEEGFAQAIKGSYDISGREYAEPIIKYLKGI